MQLTSFSPSRLPRWVRASLLVGAIALSACSTSKPSASAPAPQSNTSTTRSAASAPTQKCWFGLFTCASPTVKKNDAAVTSPETKPQAPQAAPRKCWFGLLNCAVDPVSAESKTVSAATKAGSDNATASQTPQTATRKCWFGLFNCASSPTPETPDATDATVKSVSRPNIVTVTASSGETDKAATQKMIESVITASATHTETPVSQAPASPVFKKIEPLPVADAQQQKPKRWLGIFTPYRIDIQQGNFISQEVAAKLREGMTKEQVRFLLGAPLLNDMFHAERWDYLFRLQKGNGLLTTNRLTIFFKDNRIARVESTQLPNEAEYLNHISGTDGKKPAPAPTNKTPDKAQDKPTPPTTPNTP